MRRPPLLSVRRASREQRASALPAVCALAAGAATLLAPGHARADGGLTPTVTVTETTIGAQHFKARGNESADDSGWGEWVNRLDAAIHGGRWTAALRLDSAVYWLKPADDNPDFGRFRNSVYPAKLWLTYSGRGLEITVGDAYVQFGRGLTLSMRKIDELGIDTTVRGIKGADATRPVRHDGGRRVREPRPCRRDERSRALSDGERSERADLRVGPRGGRRDPGGSGAAGHPVDARGELLAVRAVPQRLERRRDHVFLSRPERRGVRVVQHERHRRLAGEPVQGPAHARFQGHHHDRPVRYEVPSLGGHGKLYLEAATQYRTRRRTPARPTRTTRATRLYAALSLDAGPLTTTLEIKSNRNFYPMAAAVDLTRAPEFNVVKYSFVPPAETPTILDTEFGYFNACVNGGRLRGDVRASDTLLVYGQGIFADTRSENVSGGCDAQGRTVSTLPAPQIENVANDLGRPLGARVELRRRAVARLRLGGSARRTTREQESSTTARGTSSTRSRNISAAHSPSRFKDFSACAASRRRTSI